MHALVRASRVALPALAIAATACAPRATTGPATAVAPDSAAIRRDITYLASNALEGRLTGTPGNDSAAAYIVRRYVALGLQPGAIGFVQPFSALSLADIHAGRTGGKPTQNVVAILPGTDPALRGEYVVIGAHYDHLGRSTEYAMDPGAGDAIRRGADDNASGTAAVLELARLFASHPTRRTLVFANFSGEEEGLLGSKYFVDHSPVPTDSIAAMVNFDMVGRLRSDKLIVYGTATATEFSAMLDSANAREPRPLKLSAIGDGYGPSDQSSFYEKGMPVLHFFTDLHDDYHRATDDPEKIDAGGEARVVTLARDVVREIANRPTRLTFVRAAPKPVMSSAEGSKVYLGSVPDMSATDVKGMRLSGVRAGSPAERGGMRAGDVIVEFGGMPVKDIYDYSNALYSHKPGDVVKAVVLRDGQRVELTLTLGARD